MRLLDNGREIAALSADASGQFVILPPPLAAGSHELVLQTEGRDAGAQTSLQSVTVVVAETRNQAPLVTLTAPGQPSVILSRPDAPASAVVASRTEPSRPTSGATSTSAPLATSPPTSGSAAPRGPEAAPAAAAAAPPRIVSVESEGAGRLYVSGTVPPAASVRLYLNDTFVAAAAAGPDGRLAFAIESGIRPGDYRVRLDVVDGTTGAVRSRAEAPFAMPSPVMAAAGPAVPLPPPAPGRVAGLAVAAPPASAAPPGPAAAPTPQAILAPPGSTAATGIAVPGQATPPPPSLVPPGQPAPVAAARPDPPSAIAGVAVADATRRPDPPAPPDPPSTALAGATASAVSPAPPPPNGSRLEDANLAPRVTIVPEVNTAIVARGDSLWQISKRTYGSGLRYTVIFGANTPQIRDPDLIYPGQVFVLPTGEPVTVTR